MTEPPSPALAHAYGIPSASARIRERAEDFIVIEQLSFEPTDNGEHDWLWIRKRDANTHWVAQRLAAFAGVAPANVGYAGLKDRRALTTQWFSVQLPGRCCDWTAFAEPGIEILDQRRHERKLRRGTLSGNRFRLTLSALTDPENTLPERWKQLIDGGFPNYFGPQRFGHDGGNLQAALAHWAPAPRDTSGRARRPRRQSATARHRESLWLSAVRSELFNQVLSARVAQGTWSTALAGDIMMLDGSNSWFASEPNDRDLAQRLAHGDIHCTGPLWGEGASPARDQALAIEQQIADSNSLQPLIDILRGARLEHQRRALRARLDTPRIEWPSEHEAIVEFGLRAGCYATSVLRELVDVGETVTTPR